MVNRRRHLASIGMTKAWSTHSRHDESTVEDAVEHINQGLGKEELLWRGTFDGEASDDGRQS